MIPKKSQVHLVYLQKIADDLFWLEVKKENGSVQIVGSGIESLQIDEDSELSPKERFGEAVNLIRKQLKTGWFDDYKVIFIVPNHRLTARFLETPPTEEENIRDLVAFEVSEALQLSVDDVAWDMLISSEHQEAAVKQLLWVATRKGYLKSILDEWPEHALVPRQITPDFWAVYEFLLGADTSDLEAPCVVVSLDGGRASLTLCDQQAIYFTRSVMLERPQSAADQTDHSSQKERILAMEIERTLSYAADRIPQGTIRSMVLCGFEGFDLSRIEEMRQQNSLTLKTLGIEEVSSYFSLDTGISIESGHLPMMCMAYCQLQRNLAGLNLLDEEVTSAGWQNLVPEAAIPSRQFLYIAGGLLGFTLLLWIAQSIWFHQAVAARVQEGKELIQLADRLKKEETGLRELKRTDIDYADMFIFLSEIIPDNVIVKSINADVKTGIDLVLAGGNHQGTIEIIDKMNQSRFFRDIVEDRATYENNKLTVYLKGELQFSG